MTLFYLFPNFVLGTANVARELMKKLLKAMEERQKFNEIFLKKIHADGKKNKTLNSKFARKSILTRKVDRY